jgi:hypothetical protein
MSRARRQGWWWWQAARCEMHRARLLQAHFFQRQPDELEQARSSSSRAVRTQRSHVTSPMPRLDCHCSRTRRSLHHHRPLSPSPAMPAPSPAAHIAPAMAPSASSASTSAARSGSADAVVVPPLPPHTNVRRLPPTQQLSACCRPAALCCRLRCAALCCRLRCAAAALNSALHAAAALRMLPSPLLTLPRPPRRAPHPHPRHAHAAQRLYLLLRPRDPPRRRGGPQCAAHAAKDGRDADGTRIQRCVRARRRAEVSDGGGGRR